MTPPPSSVPKVRALVTGCAALPVDHFLEHSSNEVQIQSAGRQYVRPFSSGAQHCTDSNERTARYPNRNDCSGLTTTCTSTDPHLVSISSLSPSSPTHTHPAVLSTSATFSGVARWPPKVFIPMKVLATSCSTQNCTAEIRRMHAAIGPAR